MPAGAAASPSSIGVEANGVASIGRYCRQLEVGILPPSLWLRPLTRSAPTNSMRRFRSSCSTAWPPPGPKEPRPARSTLCYFKSSDSQPHRLELRASTLTGSDTVEYVHPVDQARLFIVLPSLRECSVTQAAR